MCKTFFLIYLSMISLLFLSCSSSRDIGKMFASEKANQLYGIALQSESISVSTLSKLISKTENIIMFGIINNQLIILDDKRNLLYPEKAEYKDSDVFTGYSVSRVKELLSNNRLEKGSDENISVEQREDVLSVTYGKITLETGIKCPPMCE